MAKPIDTESIISKLLKKTQAGRVKWGGEGTKFNCSLDDKFRFELAKRGDSYTLTMRDAQWNDIFSEAVEEEIVFFSDDRRHRFEMLSELYEQARRIAFDVEAKVEGASEFLDQL